MSDNSWLADEFEAHRAHLRAVAYRMLGSTSEADDALQEAWLRVSRADTTDVLNMGGWLTTVVGRVCLNMLRARNNRRDVASGGHLPDPIVTLESDAGGPEHDVVLADSVGIALLVVLETLEPAERLAFVLHDIFAVPFDEIAQMLDRSPAAARQLASRARRRVQRVDAPADTDLPRQRALVDAFFAAARAGDFDALLAVLDPDVVARADNGPRGVLVMQGAQRVASQAMTYARGGGTRHPVLVNGSAGVVVTLHGRPVGVLAFSFRNGRIASIDGIADRARLQQLALPALDD
jgi:RNA polymerase sigma-70 factor (ECF subfamily)